MKLYVCWGTFHLPFHEHACASAHDAMKEAGHDPEVIKAYGFAPLPDLTRGRKEVKKLTGTSWVPALVTDDGEVIQDSAKIIEWAGKNPAVPAP